jgi:uncharacterized protein YjdB
VVRSAVAKVSSQGVVTAVNKGTCTITCVSNEGSSVRDSVVVTVTNQSTPKSIALSPEDTAMYVGDTLYLEAAVTPENACAFVTYTSSNTSVLGVSASGRVVARKAGTATIKVTSKQSSGVYAQRKITVVPVGSPLSIVPDETYITLNPGKTAQLTATVLPETANQTLKYKSSNTNVVGVSSTGNIIGRAAGTATITFINNYSGTYNVTGAPAKLSIRANWFEITSGNTFTYDGNVHAVEIGLTGNAPVGITAAHSI